MLAARLLNLPAQCLVVEDADAGIEAAGAAGMRTWVGFAPPTPQPPTGRRAWRRWIGTRFSADGPGKSWPENTGPQGPSGGIGEKRC